MPEIQTQLRAYFDEIVERVTDEDIRIRATIERGIPIGSLRFRLRPATAAALGFGVATTLLGGVGLSSALMGSEPADVGGGGNPGAASASDPISPFVFLILAVGLGFLGFGLRAMRRSPGHVREQGDEDMQTIEKPDLAQAPPGETKLKTRNRLLTWLVGILAVAVLGLGAWLIAEMSSSSATGSLPAAAEAALDDYLAAWDATNRDAFLAATTEDYTFKPNGRVFTQAEQAAALGVSTFFEYEVFATSSTGDGPYYVGSAEQVRFSALGDFLPGQSILTLVETDAGWKVAEHVWIGDM